MLSARHRIVYVDSYGLKTLDSTEKAVVDIRPPKKMKKRRELDALANGKKHAVASSTTAQPTDRRSLVVPDDSSSSDAFVSTKRGPGQLTTNRQRHDTLCRCQSCITTMLLFLVLLCLSISAGLTVTYLQLRRELDVVRNRLVTAEQQNKDIPDQVQVMTYKITELEKTVSTMSAAQMPRLQENITAAFSHLTAVESALHSLQEAITTAPELYGLPKQMQQLSKTVADLGSHLQSTQQSQLAVVERLDAVALDCSTVNDSMSSLSDVVKSLSAQLSNMEAVVNETLRLINSRQSTENTPTSSVPWHVHLRSNETDDSQAMDDDASAQRSSVNMIERTLYKLMLDFSEHVQSAGQALEELTNRISVLEWTIDSTNRGHQQMDIVQHRLHNNH